MRLAVGMAVLAVGMSTATWGTAEAARTSDRVDRVVIDHTRDGAVVADGRGMTLYVFVDDLLTRQDACTGDCHHDWVPAVATGRVSIAQGITGYVGSIGRSGIGRQLTMDNRPLYTFAGDTPGALRGNGVGNLWWAMTPTGLTATAFPAVTSWYGPPAPTTLTVVSTRLGPAVANDRGQVLYAYTKDAASSSACQAGWCLVDWPPLQAFGVPTAPSGVTAPVSVIPSAGGTSQVVLGGHPLSTFAGDRRPGDIRGQGIGKDWYLVSPSGGLVTGSGWGKS